MRKSCRKIIPLLLILVILLSACSREKGNNDGTGKDGQGSISKVLVGNIELPHPQKVEREGEVLGGTLNIAIAASAPFQGVFNSLLLMDQIDADLMAPMWGSFIKTGDEHEIIDGGYANITFNKANKTATYKIHSDLTWSDGLAVTSDDLIYAYETIADKNYRGMRFGGDFRNIIGIEEYHEGKADNISGLKKIDEKTLEVHFKEFYPDILWGSGILYSPEPKHYLKDIPVAELESHEKVRRKPLSYGPFVMSDIVIGESVEYMANPYWFGDKPKVDKIVFTRVNPDTLIEGLKAGKFDIVKGIDVENYTDYKNLSNIDLLSTLEGAYSYLGFKFGQWSEDGVLVDKEKKMADINLRKALAYGMNNEEVSRQLYNNLRVVANSLITPYHLKLWDSGLEAYGYNPQKAKEILDEAGYKDLDGDGFREDPAGNKLQINLLARSDEASAEALVQYHIQTWKDIGLDVVLLNKRLVDINTFYDMVEEDNENIDIYMGVWGVGSNPDPYVLYGRRSPLNYPRFASEENDELLDAIISDEGFNDGGINEDYLVKAYHDWQKYMRDELVVLPSHYFIELAAVNKRVNYYDISSVNDWTWEKLGLLRDKADTAK